LTWYAFCPPAQLYFDRDYAHAKPLVEVLLDMNPADEEALCCYKVGMFIVGHRLRV
jgi:hypothetical protein